MPFLLHFYVTISPKFPIPIFSQNFSIQVLEKACFLRFFYPPQTFFGATRNSKIATLAPKRHFWPLWFCSVCLTVWNSDAPLFRQKAPKKRPSNFCQKEPQFWSKAPQFQNFSIDAEVQNDPPYHFYCIFM